MTELDKQLEDTLSWFSQGEVFDWARAKVDGQVIANRIRKVSEEAAGTFGLTVVNADINGDILLDGLGEVGRAVALQLIGCRIEGQFRARASAWARLTISGGSLTKLDIPKSRFVADLLIEGVGCRGLLEARACTIGGTLSLSGSSFEQGEGGAAVELAETQVGLSFHALNLRSRGRISASRLRVEGHVRFDGAKLISEPGSLCLDLNGARIDGELRLCFGDGTAFEARGTVVVASAAVGALVMRGAHLDGLGGQALVADQIQVRDTIDLCGLLNGGRDQFVSVGILRFVSAKIGGQVQMVDAVCSSDGVCAITLDSSDVGGDVLLGTEDAGVAITGHLSANNVSVGGRLLIAKCKIRANGCAVSIRQSEVSNELGIYDTEMAGSALLDESVFGKITIQNAKIGRSSPAASTVGLPSRYAHELDSVLNLNFCRVHTNVSIDSVNIIGGDLRFGNAVVEGLFRVTRLNISDCPGLALLGQGAKLRGGIHIAGAPESPCVFLGEVNFMGAEVGGDIVLDSVDVGSVAASSNVYVTGCSVNGSVIVHHARVYGEFGATAARIAIDVRFDGVQFVRPEQTALDLQGVVVGGRVSFTEVDHSGETSPMVLCGNLNAEGAQVGSLAWSGLSLSDGAQVALTNMVISRVLKAGPLRTKGGGHLDLTGTSAAQLHDSLGDIEDSWGAGKLSLGLIGFRYAHLNHPSGRTVSDADAIKQWRSKWLHRASDRSSTWPARHLARVLRDQGGFEAARLIQIDAFAAEGRLDPRRIDRTISWLFGLTFAHGFSGWRAFWTVVVVWLCGALLVIDVQNQNLLVEPPIRQREHTIACDDTIDPLLYAADALLPVLDIGQRKKCEIGTPNSVRASSGGAEVTILGSDYTVFGPVELAKCVWAIYVSVGWLVLSLAIATWSGLFRRAGRD